MARPPCRADASIRSAKGILKGVFGAAQIPPDYATHPFDPLKGY